MAHGTHTPRFSNHKEMAARRATGMATAKPLVKAEAELVLLALVVVLFPVAAGARVLIVEVVLTVERPDVELEELVEVAAPPMVPAVEAPSIWL